METEKGNAVETLYYVTHAENRHGTWVPLPFMQADKTPADPPFLASFNGFPEAVRFANRFVSQFLNIPGGTVETFDVPLKEYPVNRFYYARRGHEIAKQGIMVRAARIPQD